MKRAERTLCLLVMTALLALGTTRAFAEMEISLDDENSVPTPTPAVSRAKAQPEAKPAPSNPQAENTSEVVIDEGGSTEGTVTMEGAEPTPAREVRGFLKMKDIYEAGIKSYKEKDYDQAIRYLKQAVEKKDKHTPKYYYAEAHATLGVIYQFRIIRYKTAYYHYQQALKYEANNRTARKYIKVVKRKLAK